ncbi:MAG: hypothetical protein GXP31_10190 [Kiritimatiellaeota bacterium]|nr:hypothetical protein [Kiritimatiellota bacterium]
MVPGVAFAEDAAAEGIVNEFEAEAVCGGEAGAGFFGGDEAVFEARFPRAS